PSRRGRHTSRQGWASPTRRAGCRAVPPPTARRTRRWRAPPSARSPVFSSLRTLVTDHFGGDHALVGEQVHVVDAVAAHSCLVGDALGHRGLLQVARLLPRLLRLHLL